MWVSYIVLWSMCDPMFPQLFQRFYAARSEKALRFTMMMYPLVTMFLFAFPVMIGVWGAAEADFTGAPDSIMPFMLKGHAPSLIYGLVLAGGFAALMSTADSQLLVLSSMFTRDLVGTFRRGSTDPSNEVRIGRGFILLLALASLAVALTSTGTIFDLLTRTTFTGLAILFPSTIAALYWRRATSKGVIASVCAGEGSFAVLFLLEENGIIDGTWTLGFLPAIPLVALSAFVLVLVSLATAPPPKGEVERFFRAVSDGHQSR